MEWFLYPWLSVIFICGMVGFVACQFSDERRTTRIALGAISGGAMALGGAVYSFIPCLILAAVAAFVRMAG